MTCRETPPGILPPPSALYGISPSPPWPVSPEIWHTSNLTGNGVLYSNRTQAPVRIWQEQCYSIRHLRVTEAKSEYPPTTVYAPSCRPADCRLHARYHVTMTKQGNEPGLPLLWFKSISLYDQSISTWLQGQVCIECGFPWSGVAFSQAHSSAVASRHAYSRL